VAGLPAAAAMGAVAVTGVVVAEFVTWFVEDPLGGVDGTEFSVTPVAEPELVLGEFFCVVAEAVVLLAAAVDVLSAGAAFMGPPPQPESITADVSSMVKGTAAAARPTERRGYNDNVIFFIVCGGPENSLGKHHTRASTLLVTEKLP